MGWGVWGTAKVVVGAVRKRLMWVVFGRKTAKVVVGAVWKKLMWVVCGRKDGEREVVTLVGLAGNRWKKRALGSFDVASSRACPPKPPLFTSLFFSEEHTMNSNCR